MLGAITAKDEYELATHPLEPGAVVIDIGANVGGVSVAAAKLYPEAQIIAVEPDPTTYRYMMWNLKINNVTDHVWPLNAGVCSSGTHVTYSVRTMEGLQKHPDEVPCISLADLFALFQVGEVALLKVDCEGCEFHLFSSPAVSLLLPRVRRLVGEFHVPAPGTPKERVQQVYDILCASGNAVHGCKEPSVPIPL
eukprot:gnl/TRDRNA2_/TRDRNA2_116308_c1_seq1.p1 gnl/TRDRNA2_/TRDRNA2_116308_c1~~gnl/TRDRNA2_/TRDRNA2_116308_c1_seq1.p1  ORF type:complete len:218 (+),score=36.33 gnl/TRDRNA2_/TRDRNA2_116308_c1_seq1:74-655(+)